MTTEGRGGREEERARTNNMGPGGIEVVLVREVLIAEGIERRGAAVIISEARHRMRKLHDRNLDDRWRESGQERDKRQEKSAIGTTMADSVIKIL